MPLSIVRSFWVVLLRLRGHRRLFTGLGDRNTRPLLERRVKFIGQLEADRWHRRFCQLHSDVTRWHEHLANPPGPTPDDEEGRRERSFRRLFSLPDEILNAPDPLAAILAANPIAAGEQGLD